MDAKEVGSKIATIRKENGWTQKDIAERLHVSPAAVSKWERGLNYPDLTLMEPLADLLGITVAELLGVANESEDKIIKNITEISEEEKSRLAISIWKRLGLTSALIVVFLAVIIVIVVSGRNIENDELLFKITKSGLLEIIPLITGGVAWILALAGIILGGTKLKNKWKNYSIYSLICCSIALYFPGLILDLNIRITDFSTVEDITWGFNFAAIVLLIGTLLFNGLSWKINSKRREDSF